VLVKLPEFMMEDIREESTNSDSHHFGVEAQIKTVVQKRQSDLNPMFSSPVHKNANHENCMFILVHESPNENGDPLFTSETDELTEAQYASYLEFTKNYGRTHHLGDQPYYAETNDDPPITEGEK